MAEFGVQTRNHSPNPLHGHSASGKPTPEIGEGSGCLPEHETKDEEGGSPEQSNTKDGDGNAILDSDNSTVKKLRQLREELDEVVQTLALYPTLREQADILRDAIYVIGLDDESTHEPEDPDIDIDIDIEVKRLSMEDYQKSIYIGEEDHTPVIKAYYYRLPSNMSTVRPTSLRRRDTQLRAESEKVQRIQINSDTLIEELRDITGVKLDRRPVLLPPPFKLLLQFFPQIEKRLTNLKGDLAEAALIQQNGAAENDVNWKTSSIKSSSPLEIDPLDSSHDPVLEEAKQDVSPSNSKAGETTPITKAQSSWKANQDDQKKLTRRVKLLETLCNFIRTDLNHLLELRAKIENRTLDSIAFEDLWHLFRHGELALSIDGKRKQLFKIYSVTGGQQRKRNRTENEKQDLNRLQDRLAYRRAQAFRDDDPNEDSEMELEKLMAEESSLTGSWAPLVIVCYMMNFDGSQVGPVEVYKQIKYYPGEKKITKLEVYPLAFRPDKDDFLAKMELRGRKFISSIGHKSYDGLTLSTRHNEPVREIHGDVYIDFESYYRQYPKRKPKLGKILKSRPDRTQTSEHIPAFGESQVLLSGEETDEKLIEDFIAENRRSLQPIEVDDILNSPEYLRLLPYWVIGFVFRLRDWYVELLEDIDKSDEARDRGFQDLVIPKDVRTLLVALVENHNSSANLLHEKSKSTDAPSTQIDLVRGKGGGLIILLHGPPGSGKTSTAETIAAYTRRPLYAITCGDLGDLAVEVETRLEAHSHRADKWGCVLLLDEADVFLVQRDWKDLHRNALVSIFLRKLEYYSGILFLTTNRVGVIDEAFKSRIHVSLLYPDVRLDATRQIWSNILDRLERDNETAEIKIAFDRNALMKFAEEHYRRHEKNDATWNGRQIRNAFQTAIALGHFQRQEELRKAGMTPEEAAASSQRKWKTVKLSRAYFQNVANTAHTFEQYLVRVRGLDKESALNDRLRDDDFDPLFPHAPRAQKNYAAGLPWSSVFAPPTPTSSAVSKSATPSKMSKSAVQSLANAGEDAYDEDLSDEAFDGDSDDNGS